MKRIQRNLGIDGHILVLGFCEKPLMSNEIRFVEIDIYTYICTHMYVHTLYLYCPIIFLIISYAISLKLVHNVIGSDPTDIASQLSQL